MANRSFQRDQFTNEVNVVRLYAKVTGAADVQADGYTVNSGSGYISTVTRTAEGEFKCNLADSYAAFLGGNVLIGKDDSVARFTAEDVDSATAPYVQFEVFSAGSAADPDSAVMYIELILRNSSVS